jgi:pimeloyl-ACP methyl ester carboxylesterase
VAGLLLVTGSGAQDRDESAAGHKFFLVLADYLTRRGFAVLRVDDRGIGGSTGSTSLATTMDFVGDAIAGVEFLKLTDGIDPLRIGLIGHSEGGLIASLAAKRSSDVAFIVMMGAIGMPGAQAVELQHEVFGKAAGHSPSRIAFDVAMEKAMFAILRATPDDAKAIEQMNALWEQRKASLAHAALTLEEQRLILASDAAIKQRIKALPTPWNRYFLSYDPTEALQQVHCPILVVSGSLDLQAPPRAHFPAIRSALASAENRDVTLLEIPGVNHAMQTAITGLPSEYATIQETFSPVVLSAIGDWVKAHAALEGQPPR